MESHEFKSRRMTSPCQPSVNPWAQYRPSLSVSRSPGSLLKASLSTTVESKCCRLRSVSPFQNAFVGLSQRLRNSSLTSVQFFSCGGDEISVSADSSYIRAVSFVAFSVLIDLQRIPLIHQCLVYIGKAPDDTMNGWGSRSLSCFFFFLSTH